MLFCIEILANLGNICPFLPISAFLLGSDVLRLSKGDNGERTWIFYSWEITFTSRAFMVSILQRIFGSFRKISAHFCPFLQFHLSLMFFGTQRFQCNGVLELLLLGDVAVVLSSIFY